MKRYSFRLIGALLLVASSCSDKAIPVSNVSIFPTTLTMIIGDNYQFSAKIYPEDADEKQVTWSSSSIEVVSINDAGLATALQEGVATITASAEGKTGDCKVVVERKKVSKITLDKVDLALFVGETYTLHLEIEPDDATDKAIVWTTSEPSVATVTDGCVTAVAPGQSTIMASAGELREICSVTVSSEEPTMVDMGLPVLWANRNIGARRPEDYGEYFAWGEMEAKSEYSWGTYRWGSSETSLSKYNTIESNGIVDRNLVLDLEDDVAHVRFGEKWRLPTYQELAQLSGNSDVTGTLQNGIFGFLVTSKLNGNSIFFPATGFWYGDSLIDDLRFYYWTSTLDSSRSDNNASCDINKDYSNVFSIPRCQGLPIRPVYGDYIRVNGISLDQSSISLYEGGKAELSATITPDDAFDKGILWHSSDPSVATVTGGQITAISAGKTTVSATTSDGGFTACCIITVPEEPIVPEGAVDLGIIVINSDGKRKKIFWAEKNIGAISPEDIGDYYAWGETETKTDYSVVNYKWFDGNPNSILKYNDNGANGVVDNKLTLDLEDDVAHVKLGGNWRIPTYDELYLLISKCTTSRTVLNNVPGCLFTSKTNGNTIFLPATGFFGEGSILNLNAIGMYWSSSIAQNIKYGDWQDGWYEAGDAHTLYFSLSNSEESGWSTFVSTMFYRRDNPYPIRPVFVTESY